MTPPAPTAHVLGVALTVTAALCLAAVLLVVLLRIGRRLRTRRRATLLAPYRQDLLVVGAGEDRDGAAARRMAAATGPAATVLTEAIRGLLTKIRGGPADELVQLLRARGTIARAGGELSGSSRRGRAEAARLLGLCREASAVPLLVAALDDPAVEVRAHAAHALGRIGTPATAGPLLGAVGATGAGIPAGIAAEALLAMGTGVAGALLEGLAAPHPRTRSVAAHVSGVGAFTRSRPSLRALLTDDPDLTVREVCAEALGVIGGPEDAAALARHTRDDEPLPLRRACATALGALGEPAGLTALTTLLRDPDPRLAELAATAVLRLGPEASAGLARIASTEPPDPLRGRPVRSALLMAELRGATR